MQSGSSTNRGGLLSGAEKAAAALPRAGAMMIATQQRVSNTRRMIAQSRALVERARQTLQHSRSVRGLMQRASEPTQ